MTMDIVVTTPKNKMASAAKEAEDALAGKVNQYFRSFRRTPKELKVGTKIYYVEEDKIVGYAVVNKIDKRIEICMTTGARYKGIIAYMNVDSWTWIEPIPYKGFRGFRYLYIEPKILGGWTMAKPN